jgi:hypothetical protein
MNRLRRRTLSWPLNSSHGHLASLWTLLKFVVAHGNAFITPFNLTALVTNSCLIVMILDIYNLEICECRQVNSGNSR